MRTLQKYDAYKTEKNTLIYVEENDITEDCPLMVVNYTKAGPYINVRNVVPLKENTETKLKAMFHKFGALTYLGNFENFDEAMEQIA